MIKTNKTLEPKWILILIFFVAGLFLGGLSIYIWYSSRLPNMVRIRSALTYKYINPLLGVDINPAQGFSVNKTLQLKIHSIINKYQSNKSISVASVYFRDINAGIWMGINENDKFSPGKLLRIPIMIAYFKLIESKPEILEEEFEVKPNEIYKGEEVFKPEKPIQVGGKYTTNELIEKMIVDSSNTAANVLFDNIDKKSLDEVFSDLGIEFKEDKLTQDFIPLKLYSLFFMVLYNSTYLNREFSEKALELLVATPNYFGIAVGIPKNIPIADLIGARTFTSDGEKNYEVYDCGIIYYDNNPYNLCGVVRGKDLSAAKDLLKEVGAVVYEEMKFRYGK